MKNTLEKKRKKGGMKRILAILMAICVTASMGCFGDELVMAEVNGEDAFETVSTENIQTLMVDSGDNISTNEQDKETNEIKCIGDNELSVSLGENLKADTYCSGCDTLLVEGTTSPMIEKVDNHLEVFANGQKYLSPIHVNKGGSTELYVTVSADNTDNLTYSWGYYDYDNNNLWVSLDSTTERCTITDIQKAMQYCCEVTDCYGNIEDAWFNVRVENHLKVLANGQEYIPTILVNKGESAELYVTVSADKMDNLTYSWGYHDDKGLWVSLDSTTSSCTITDVQKATHYGCTVTDCYGNAGNAWFNVGVENHLKVLANGQGYRQNVYVAQGESAELYVAVSADNMDNITYRWGYYDSNDSWIWLDSTKDRCTIVDVQNAKECECTVIDCYGNQEQVWFNVGIENHLKVLANGQKYIPTILVNKGESAELYVTVSADKMDNLTYSWGYHDDKGLWISLDSTTSCCTITDVQKALQYSCIVTDCYGNTEHVWFNVGIENHLKVLANGQNYNPPIYVTKGGSAELYVTVSADNMDNITYSWGYYDSNDSWISLDSTKDRCAIVDVQKAKEYECIVTDCYGNTEYAWFNVGIENHLKVLANGQGYRQNIYVAQGESTELYVAVSADNMDNITYSWGYYDSNDSWISLDSTKDRCAIVDVQKAKEYECIVTDCYGNTKNVWFNVGIENHLKVLANGNEHCPDIIVNQGDNAELFVEVSADNTDILRYNWGYYDENAVWISLDSTTEHCTITDVRVAREYGCKVTDCYGNTEEAWFNVEIKNNLKVLANGQGETSTVLVNKGESAELYVTVSADKMDNLTYRWGYYDDNGLWTSLDNTTTHCTITDVQEAREYDCIVTDYYGNKESVWFKVGIDNHLAVYPAGTKDLFKEVFVSANEPFSLEVDVSADDKEGLVYKWFYSNMDDKISGSIPVGENPNVCKIDGLSRYMTYRCEVTDRYGNTADTFFYVYVNGDTLTANDSGNPIADIEAKKGENVTLEVHSKNGNEAKYTYTWRYWDSEKQQSVTLSSQTSMCVIENVQKDMQIGVTIKDPDYGNIYYLNYNIIVKENSQDGDAGNSGSGNTGDSGNSGNGDSGNAGGSGNSEAGGGSSTGAGSGAGGGASTGAGSGTGTVTETPDTAKDKNENKSVTITKNPDGSRKEIVKETETNSKKKKVTVTTTTETNSKGKVTGVTEKSKIDNIAAGTAATVTVKKDGKDKVTSATASVSKTLTKDSKKTTISASVVEQLKEAAGTDVDVTMTVKGDDGKTKYKIKVDTADLKAGKDLYIYQLNTKTGEYTMVNAKKYAVSKNGNVSVSMDKNATYELVSEKDAKKLEKKILSSVKVKKSETSVKKGKKTAVALSSGLNMKNVKSISYSTSSKSVATVSKTGSVTAKKPGTTTIKVKVTLKNGTTKTVKMKITVK